VEGIELLSALALLLQADLGGARKRLLERRIKLCWPAILRRIATEPRAQQAQLALEPFGVGVTAGHHRRPLGDA
jgi:hypothetical protein